MWAVRLAADIIHSSPGTVFTDYVRPWSPGLAKVFRWWGYASTLLIVVWMPYRAKLEDALMEKVFGEAWRKWKEKTPYSIVPYIY